VSDFAEYNSSNLNSNFYQNVVVNFEDKEITCDYFDVDMKTNIAKAYNNVVVTEPGSIMKADRIILNIETNVIDINPDNNKKEVTVTIN
jgi:lipopolysaccharide export system protein LptA